ncbi:hypothetical protein [Crocosphaera sp. Alani8]|uniref:hypothetical protein n=1 Tax=Crocosphaera sp. Alani8 TaxID=3038952 RepID=UPI00313E993F
MGEAKRRKKLDPNYGQRSVSDLKGGLSSNQWREKLGFSLSQWQKVWPDFQVVENIEKIDEGADGVWIYGTKEGTEGIYFSGKFMKAEFLLSLPKKVQSFYSDDALALLGDEDLEEDDEDD